MVASGEHLTTGLAGLDRVLKGLRLGDNVVFQVDAIEDYRFFVGAYARSAIAAGKNLIYFRFARHEPLIDEHSGIRLHTIRPDAGFETFITQLHQVISDAGRGAYYIFDCLSDLAVDWYSDEMVGNCFMLTCPYLYDLETIAYFALKRNFHSSHATTPIGETTQILLEVMRYKDRYYVHPLKVQQRYSPTMHMLHVLEGEEMRPVTDSVTTAEVLTSIPRTSPESPVRRLDVWSRTFLQAEEVLGAIGRCECSETRTQQYLQRLLRMAITRDERIQRLAEQYLTIADVLEIGKRMIGTGLIGGKSVGMLLARAILCRNAPRWADLLEVHDSFFIGSDVFYTYLVRNGCWWVREKQRHPETVLQDAEKARQRILMGKFPEHIEDQFADMLDYYGQSPIIVRSSSLLEDNFGNSFAGKYESVFCPNQGSHVQRLEDFKSAVRTIYASTMSEKALRYRAQRGILDRDEQMALLVQRVSGHHYNRYYFPQVAGVGFSFNPYVWNEEIDPTAGVLRIVFGLGTRAVDRSDNDYTRVVALNDPERRPEASFDEVRRYAQRRTDFLDLEANQLDSAEFAEVAAHCNDLPLEMFASRDYRMERMAQERGVRDVFPWVLTFQTLFTETDFIRDMREMLQILHKAYDYPVDVEFTANFVDSTHYKINLVQCRPLQVKEGGAIPDPPTDIRPEDTVLVSSGAVVGQSRLVNIDRIIYVTPFAYAQLSGSDRCSVARVVGELAHQPSPTPTPPTIMLLGPGRWGTTMPSLGVPVTFAEINTVSILCEIVAMREDLTPEVSLGTHFFSELVEMDILYLAIFPFRKETFLSDFFERAPNKLTQLLPRAEKWMDVIRVIDPADLVPPRRLQLCANAIKQKVVAYFET